MVHLTLVLRMARRTIYDFSSLVFLSFHRVMHLILYLFLTIIYHKVDLIATVHDNHFYYPLFCISHVHR